MNQKAKSRTDGHQAALETSTAWVSRFYSTTLYSFVEEVRQDG